MTRWEFASLEWIWQDGTIRINLPGEREAIRRGGYQEVVELLCALGRDCWDVAACVAEGDWMYWTLKRPFE